VSLFFEQVSQNYRREQDHTQVFIGQELAPAIVGVVDFQREYLNPAHFQMSTAQRPEWNATCQAI